MANRVVLGALPGGGSGLRVSRPGYDVLSTSLTQKQVAFDSRWPAAMRLVKSGSATTSSSPGVGATVMFGVALPVEPMCFVLTKSGSLYNLDTGTMVVTVRKDRMIVTGLPVSTTISYYVFSR
jgi:hypothetical protein